MCDHGLLDSDLRVNVRTTTIQQQQFYERSALIMGVNISCSSTSSRHPHLTLLGLHSRFGDELLRIRLVCAQNGSAVLTVLNSPKQF